MASATEVICESCGTLNEAGRKFCLECGTRLAVACPECGAANTPGAKFCGECGSAVAPTDQGAERGAEREAGAPEAPVAERRVVTVLFADLVGFTGISETRDAEDVRELLGRYFETCQQIVERYGGTIEKFIGDAVMAVWGTPVAREDDAERAVRAAIDLVGAAHRLGEADKIPQLSLRAGIMTGEAAVTLGASSQGMVAGDLVNTASRLQSVAEPGMVLVGDPTRRAAAGAIAFEAAGEQTLRGKATPVPAFRALRVVAKRGGAGRSEQLEPPFVGRDAELQLVKDFYHATAREGSVRLVSVLGQAGIGKTRLAWEFLKYVDGLSETVYWHQGRSPAYGDGVSFWALGEMVRMRAGIGEGDDEQTTRGRLSAVLDEFITDPDERRRIEPALLQLLGLEGSAVRERDTLFAAWRTFFERIADVSTVALVFEDLQWADDGLLDFIEQMLAWSRGRSIFIITLSRPELLDRRPTWGAGQRAFTSLGLTPLPATAMRELLAGLVPGLPEPLAQGILDRAEGIPLYAVETVRMLVNDGQLELVDGVYRLVGDLTQLAVPESLHALIAARLDALRSEHRSLLQDAAVLGQSFTRDAVAAVTQLPPAELEPLLRDLAQRELLMLDDDPRSPERGQFRFVQALIREVAYGTLSRRDRRARHLAAARHFETRDDEEIAGVLAHHYLDAYRAQPDGPDGAAVAAQARVALRAAAQRARDLGSHDQALAFLMQGLEVADDRDEELVLRFSAGVDASNAGRFETAVPLFERAIVLARELGDDAARRRAIARLGDVFIEGRQERARELLEEALTEEQLRADDPGFAVLAEAMAKLEMRTLHHDRAVDWAEKALPAAEASGDERLVLELLVTRDVSLSHLGRPLEAAVGLTGSRAIAEQHGLIEVALRATINLAYVLEPEETRQGFEVSRDGVDLARRYGARWGLRYLVGNGCDSALQAGEWDWIDAQLGEELHGDLEPAERIWFGSYDLQLRAYRGETVDRQARELVELAGTFDDVQYRGMAAASLFVADLVGERLDDAFRIILDAEAAGAPDAAPYGARVAAWRGDAAGVRRMLRLHEHARPGRRTATARAAMEGLAAHLEGRAAEARQHLSEAIRGWRELGLDFERALCQLDVVRLAVMEGPDLDQAAGDARAVFERLRASALLAKLDAALGEHLPADRDGSTPRRRVEPARAG